MRVIVYYTARNFAVIKQLRRVWDVYSLVTYLQCRCVVAQQINRLRSPGGSQPIESVICMSVAYELFHSYLLDDVALTDDVDAGGKILGTIAYPHTLEIVDLDGSREIDVA